MRYMFHPFKLLGGEKNYLLLFQNNYELRPTGGFISAFGLLTIKNGIPTSFNFEDVYGTIDDHDFVQPPEPLDQLLADPNYKGHTFRDANVAPNFPTTAADLEGFLHKTRPFQKIDGVVSVDMSFLEYWLDAVRGVSINGTTYTSTTVFEQLENQVSNVDLHDVSALENRKSFTKDLIKAMVKKSALPWNHFSVLNSFRKAFDDKHAQLFFKDEKLETIARNAHWAGTLTPAGRNDLLAIVDANYGGGKSNRYIQRSVFYAVDLLAGKSKLYIRYDHPGQQNVPLSTDYKGYVRVYLPNDHVVDNAQLSGKENGLTYGGFAYRLPVESTQTLSADISFPRSIFDELHYQLHVQKQPGTFDDYYEIAVRIPQGMHVVSGDFSQRENIAIWKGLLTHDIDLSFEVAPDTFAPRVIRQGLGKINELVLEFNEPIEPTSVLLEKIRVRDSNVTLPQYDDLKIVSYKVEGKKITFVTDTMTAQPEERYIVEVGGLRDLAGNELPQRTYTFVQRLAK
ncbi:DUF4012 domain-containing protein [Candidatus Gracilibacteria bacterium]|nr:DUF4012 domain-containing protein [Candidatus Gracilibacteria bacterium]